MVIEPVGLVIEPVGYVIGPDNIEKQVLEVTAAESFVFS